MGAATAATVNQTKEPTTMKMSYAQFQKLSPAEQKAAFEAATAAQSKLTMKVSEKGCISVYGLQKFPVSLYAPQWERVFGLADSIRAFAQANEALIAERSARDTVTVEAPTVAEARQSVLIPAKR